MPIHLVLSKAQAPVAVARPHEISLTGLNELLFSVLANRFEKPGVGRTCLGSSGLLTSIMDFGTS